MTLERFLLLLAYGLACYRVAYLITKEYGPFDVFKRFRGLLGRWANATNEQGSRAFIVPAVAELFHCPYCLGMWIALALALIFFRDSWLLCWLVIAGVQSAIQSLSK